MKIYHCSFIALLLYCRYNRALDHTFDLPVSTRFLANLDKMDDVVGKRTENRKGQAAGLAAVEPVRRCFLISKLKPAVNCKITAKIQRN